MLDHLKWRYTGHWSIPSSWQWGGREGSMHGMRGLSSFGGSTQCLQRQSCRFWQSVWGCWRSTEVWESHPLMTNFPQSVWHSSGRVSLLPGSLVVKPSSLLGARIRPGPIEPWGFNLDLPSLERGTSRLEGSMFELCSPSQSMEEPNRTLLSKLSFLFKQKTTKRACPGSDRRYDTNQDQSKVSKEQNVLFPGSSSCKTTYPGPFLHKTLENMQFYNCK